MAEGVGIPPPATKWPAEGIYVLLVNSRTEWSKRCMRGWSEMTPASSQAAARVRACTETALGGTTGGAEGCYGLLVVQ